LPLKAILLSALIIGILFAWRAWRQLPALAVGGVGVAVGAAALMLRTPLLILVGIAAAGVLAGYMSRPR